MTTNKPDAQIEAAARELVTLLHLHPVPPPTVVFVVQIVTPLFPAVDTGAQWDDIEPARMIRQRRLDEGFTPDQLRIVRRTITEEVVE